MLTSFKQIKEKIKSSERKKVAIVCAEDEEVLMAIRQAQNEGLAGGILVGDEDAIKSLAKQHNISLKEMEIIHEPDAELAAELCCELIHEKKASVIMKGLIETSKFMKAILHKEKGLNKGNLLSHVGVFQLAKYHKLLIITDAAINIAPDIDHKAKIIQNAVDFAHTLGNECPFVACCAALEKVNSGVMPATAEAACLAKMGDRGQISGCIIDGPLGFDSAIDAQSAKVKKLKGPVAGNADIILCNDIEAANFLYKGLTLLSECEAGGVVTGAVAPIVLTSRSDSHNNKYLSIILAIMNSK